MKFLLKDLLVYTSIAAAQSAAAQTENAGKTILVIDEKNNPRPLKETITNALENVMPLMAKSANCTPIGVYRTDVENVFDVYDGFSRTIALLLLNGTQSDVKMMLANGSVKFLDAKALKASEQEVFTIELSVKDAAKTATERFLHTSIANAYNNLSKAAQVAGVGKFKELAANDCKTAINALFATITDDNEKEKTISEFKGSKLFQKLYGVPPKEQEAYAKDGKAQITVTSKFAVETSGLCAGRTTTYDLYVKALQQTDKANAQMDSLESLNLQIVEFVTAYKKDEKIEASTIISSEFYDLFGTEMIDAMIDAYKTKGSTNISNLNEVAQNQMAKAILEKYYVGTTICSTQYIETLLKVHTAYKILKVLDTFIVPAMVGNYTSYSPNHVISTVKKTGKITKTDVDKLLPIDKATTELMAIEAITQKYAGIKFADNSNFAGIYPFFVKTYCKVDTGSATLSVIENFLTVKQVAEIFENSKLNFTTFMDYSKSMSFDNDEKTKDAANVIAKDEYSRFQYITELEGNNFVTMPSIVPFMCYDLEKAENDVKTLFKAVATEKTLQMLVNNGKSDDIQKMKSEFANDDDAKMFAEILKRCICIKADADAEKLNKKTSGLVQTYLKNIRSSFSTKLAQSVNFESNPIVYAVLCAVLESITDENIDVTSLCSILENAKDDDSLNAFILRMTNIRPMPQKAAEAADENDTALF
jgi:hypothetical protein